LVDGSFFLKRYNKLIPEASSHPPQRVAKNMYQFLMRHVGSEYLYRILFYDCVPFGKKLHNPITGRAVDFSKTVQAEFRRQFHQELRKLRKVALRLGQLQDRGRWIINPDKGVLLLKKRIQVSDLTENDVSYDLRQKGVDIKIGLDIASLAYKRFVRRIVLVAGDCDFVPAAKLARREGIDFILDPMWNPIDPNLHEHIDGLRSTCPRPGHLKKLRKPVPCELEKA